MALAACSGSDPDVLATVYRVEVEQCQAVDLQLATAVAVGPDLAATVAHSLDEAKGLSLQDADGVTVGAEIVYIDPATDVAILRIDGTPTPPTPLELAAPEETGPVSIATATNPGAEGPSLKTASIIELVTATLDGEGRREAIKLQADIKPGDSGAAVLNADDQMVGMVFATARNDEIGWAVAISEIEAALTAVNDSRPEAIPLVC